MATQTKMVSAKTQAANPTKYSTSQVDPSLTGGTANRSATPAPVTPTVEAPKQYNAGGGVISPYNKPITSSAMTPAPSVALPTPATPAATAPVQASVNASNATTTKASEAATAAQANATPTQSDNLSNFMKEQLGIQTEMTDAKASIDRAEQQKQQAIADEYTIQSEQEAQTAKLAIEALQKNNPQGLFGGALQDEVNRINRDSLSQQANLAILQNAALRRYDRAKSIADEQLAMKLEPLKMKLDNLKLFYGENKELLSKADDRAYNELIKTKDREYKKIEDTETQLNEIKKNVAQYAGADAANIINQLSKIDSKSPDAVSKALTLAGKYQSDPLDRAIKQAQLSKLNADASKTRSDARLAGTAAVSTEAQSWADAVSRGSAKLSDVPKNLKTAVISAMRTAAPNQQVLNTLHDKLTVIDGVLSNKGGLRGVVGPNKLARSGLFNFSTFTGSEGDFIAGVNQLTNQETLTTLLDLKKAGGTLGALSEGEGRLLREAATKINSWAKKDKDGNVYGYRTSEKSFEEELKTLRKYTERAIKESSGGGANTTESYLDTIDSTLSDVNSPYASYLNQ